MKRRKTAQCEVPGCTKPPVKQAPWEHLFEDQWCCQECLIDPLGLKKLKAENKTEIDTLTDELKVKREEFLVIKRRLDEEMRQAKRVVNEQEFKVREAIFKSLVTFETPRPLLEYWTNQYNANKYVEAVTPEQYEEHYKERRAQVPTVEDLIFGGWSCPASPTGHCMYDDHNDTCHDNCLFCGDPEERK